MPAEFDTGMFVREPAWHGEGYVADRYPENWAEARSWAGLTWEPIEVPVFEYSGITAEGEVTYTPEDAVTGTYKAIEGRKRICRNDTGETLGVPSNNYQIITHEAMGEVNDAILELPNVKYETAGSLQGGRCVWSLAYLDEPITLPGDNSETLPYLALTNRHDGTGALRVQSTSVRIVCSNTFSAAEARADKDGTVFTFRHSAQWRDRIDEARRAIRGVRQSFEDYREFAEELLRVRVTHEQTETFIREFIAMPEESLISARVRTNVETARDTLRTILSGPTTETIAGTAFGLVQASGEYLDHYRRYRSRETHYARQLLRTEPLKAYAAKLVREVAKV